MNCGKKLSCSAHVSTPKNPPPSANASPATGKSGATKNAKSCRSPTNFISVADAGRRRPLWDDTVCWDQRCRDPFQCKYFARDQRRDVFNNKRLCFQSSGYSNQLLVIEASTNLEAGPWLPLETNVVAAGPIS